ncbi:MAG: head-tail connector protein [Oscillospiraceae bacterium]
MKISEVTVEDIKRYIHITDNEDDALIGNCIEAAKSYILDYTALTAEDADGIPNLVYALYCICSDMYNVRDMTVQADKMNRMAQCILDMHRRNLVG